MAQSYGHFNFSPSLFSDPHMLKAIASQHPGAVPPGMMQQPPPGAPQQGHAPVPVLPLQNQAQMPDVPPAMMEKVLVESGIAGKARQDPSIIAKMGGPLAAFQIGLQMIQASKPQYGQTAPGLGDALMPAAQGMLQQQAKAKMEVEGQHMATLMQEGHYDEAVKIAMQNGDLDTAKVILQQKAAADEEKLYYLQPGAKLVDGKGNVAATGDTAPYLQNSGKTPGGQAIWSGINPETGELEEIIGNVEYAKTQTTGQTTAAQQAKGAGMIASTNAALSNIDILESAMAEMGDNKNLEVPNRWDRIVAGGARFFKPKHKEDPTIPSFDAAQKQLQADVQKVISGATVSDAEREFLKDAFLFRPSDSPDVIAQKLRALRMFYSGQVAEAMMLMGASQDEALAMASNMTAGGGSPPQATSSPDSQPVQLPQAQLPPDYDWEGFIVDGG